MIEETMRAILSSEEKAGELVENTEKECREIKESAEREAVTLEKEILQDADEKVAKLLSEVRKEMTDYEHDRKEKIESEVDLLRELAEQKKDAAIKAVMRTLA